MGRNNPDRFFKDPTAVNPRAGQPVQPWPSATVVGQSNVCTPANNTQVGESWNPDTDAATALGIQPYTANDLAKRIGNVLGLTPLGVAGSALDLIDEGTSNDDR